ncbi:MAG: sigma-54 dependent transcriptional regulator [Gammaproteobacteria bacterium]
MSVAPYILVVDDEPDIGSLVRDILQDEGYQVVVADCGEAARQARRVRRPDLTLLDIWMPDTDGISLLKEWSEAGGLSSPVIMMSGHGTVETAVEATRLGAYDFIEKPLSLAKLLLTVQRALQADRLRKENIGLRRHAQVVAEPIGKSPAMQQVREQIKRIAQHDSWVLINGEAGSGKELFARYLHSLSSRNKGPFIDVGVTSIARENSATELFGSEDGGNIHFGHLEQANGGTLFLGEISEMGQETQARLLGALQNQSFMRLGGSDPVQVNVRIIAATQHDLKRAVEEKRFREDLYFHLNVVPLQVPPLREHAQDVPELLNYYVNEFVNQESLPYRSFSVAAQNRLRNYPWPGNVRELKNLVQRLLILGSGIEISLEEVEAALGTQPHPQPDAPQAAYDLPLREARDQFEKMYLEHVMAKTGGSVGKTAKLAGLERTHLYRKLRALGIDTKMDTSEK